MAGAWPELPGCFNFVRLVQRVTSIEEPDANGRQVCRVKGNEMYQVLWKPEHKVKPDRNRRFVKHFISFFGCSCLLHNPPLLRLFNKMRFSALGLGGVSSGDLDGELVLL